MLRKGVFFFLLRIKLLLGSHTIRPTNSPKADGTLHWQQQSTSSTFLSLRKLSVPQQCFWAFCGALSLGLCWQAYFGKKRLSWWMCRHYPKQHEGKRVSGVTAGVNPTLKEHSRSLTSNSWEIDFSVFNVTFLKKEM